MISGSSTLSKIIVCLFDGGSAGISRKKENQLRNSWKCFSKTNVLAE